MIIAPPSIAEIFDRVHRNNKPYDHDVSQGHGISMFYRTRGHHPVLIIIASIFSAKVSILYLLGPQTFT